MKKYIYIRGQELICNLYTVKSMQPEIIFQIENHWNVKINMKNKTLKRQNVEVCGFLLKLLYIHTASASCCLDEADGSHFCINVNIVCCKSISCKLATSSTIA